MTPFLPGRQFTQRRITPDARHQRPPRPENAGLYRHTAGAHDSRDLLDGTLLGHAQNGGDTPFRTEGRQVGADPFHPPPAISDAIGRRRRIHRLGRSSHQIQGNSPALDRPAQVPRPEMRGDYGRGARSTR